MRLGYRAARYLERLAAARAAIDDLAVDDGPDRGLPRRDRRGLRRDPRRGRRGRVRQRVHLRLLPAPGQGPPRIPPRFVDDDVIRDRFARLVAVIERLRAAPQRRPRGARRRGAGRGAEQEGRADAHRPHPPRESPSTSPRNPPSSPRARSRRSRSPTARRTTCSASWNSVTARPDTARGSDRRTMSARLALVGPTASGKSRAAHRRGSALWRDRDRLARRDGRSSTAAWTWRRRSPTPAERAGGALPPRRRARRQRGRSTVGGSRPCTKSSSTTSPRAGRTGAARRGLGALPAAPRSTVSRFRRRTRPCAVTSRQRR